MKKVCLYFVGGTFVVGVYCAAKHVMDTYFDPENSKRNYNRIAWTNNAVACVAAAIVGDKVFHNITEMLK